MAGGIFVDQPFHPNPKCLLFSTLLMLLYWFLPCEKNAFLLPVIFILSYVAMAWYDYRFNCDLIMRSGSMIGVNTIDAIFKPQHRNDPTEIKNLSNNQEREYLKRVYLFHVIAVAPLLMYIGYKGVNAHTKTFPVLFVIGATALLYHGLRVFVPRDTSCENCDEHM